jgi:tRNA A-37 threonylcarbamoyl transferase component Bud32
MVTVSELKRIGRGREAEIFAWDGGAILKLYFHAVQGRGETEAAAMRAAKAAGAPAPGIIDTVEVDGRPGLVMERCDGPDMLTQFGRKPWTVFDAGRAMGVAHAQLHAVAAPPELRNVKDGAGPQIRSSPLVPDELREVGIAALARMPDGDRLCHGDYHPGNVILTAEGPRVIDWPNAFRGDPHADVARTLVTMRVGEPPAGTAALVRVLTFVGRRIITAFYLRGYRSVRPLDAAALDGWMLPVAIHRLGDDIPEEREAVLKLIAELRADAR